MFPQVDRRWEKLSVHRQFAAWIRFKPSMIRDNVTGRRIPEDAGKQKVYLYPIKILTITIGKV